MRQFVVLIALLLLTFSVSAQEGAPKTCPESLPPRLTVGEAARVTPGDANNVRTSTSAGSELVGQLAGGSVFSVVDGPLCDGGFTWWRVRQGEILGWTVEGSAEYWLEPLPGMAVYEDEYIRFAYYADSMGEIVPEYLDADPSTNRMGGPTPEQYFYHIEEWPTELDWQRGRIAFAPAAQITQETWRHNEVWVYMRELLRTEPADPLDLPTLASGVGRLGEAKTTYVNLVNGRGLAYVTMYAQDIFAFVPDQYEFYGLTNNGEYLVWINLPTLTEPTSIPFNRADYIDLDEATLAQYDAYAREVAAVLGDRPDDQFAPNLADLRRMIETVQILGTPTR